MVVVEQRLSSSSRGGTVRVVARALGVLAVVIGGVGCVPQRPLSTGEPPASVLLEVDRQGGKVTEDDRVLDRLAGDAEPTALAVAAAVCVNDDMFLRDVTLRPVVVVSSSSRLLRLAELLAAGEVDAGVAGAIEAVLFEDPGLSVGELATASGVGRGAVEDYLDATSQAPSAESADRFVVFIASRHLDKQRLFVIDREGVDYSSLELSDKTSFTTLVFVDGGWVEVDAGPDDCVTA